MSINEFFNIDERLLRLDKEITEKCESVFKEIDGITEYNQLKVLNAYIKNGVSESAMAGSTGYGYDDRGREILEKVMADVMGAEDALLPAARIPLPWRFSEYCGRGIKCFVLRADPMIRLRAL